MTPLSPPFNWYLGWGLVLASFVTGAGIGIRFHRESFLGGYGSFPRRLLRLGHIAFAALGMANVLYALSPWTHPVASAGFAIGGCGMPAVCFLTAWRKEARGLFLIPVLALVTAVAFTLIGGAR
jgi:hypothetical protein